MKPDQIRSWAREYDSESADFRAGDIEGDIQKYCPGYEKLGRRVLGNFLSIVKKT